jgi:RNA polymerase sigma-70 factor (ECF subfamily)
MSMHEPALIEQAKAGDREAFAELYEPAARPLAAFLYRLLALSPEAEDLAQDTALRALASMDSYPGAVSFRAWLFRMGAEAALERLNQQTPWHPDLQIRFGQKAAESDAVRRRVRKAHGSGLHSTYEINEHIDYCFVCMGRTLPPSEDAALLLFEVHGFSLDEAAEVLSTTPEAVRHWVEQARRTLADHFEPRCSLINAKGSCTLCAGYHTLFHGDRRRTEQALFQIDLQARPTPQERAATLDQRLAIVRAIDPLHAAGTKFHESLMTITLEKSHS